MPRNLAISCNTNGANELLGAATGYKYRVYGYVLAVAGAVSLTFKSASTALTGAIPFAAAGDKLVAPMPPPTGDGAGFWFETAAGEALNAVLSAGVYLYGHLSYEKIKVMN